ncbi:MAG TPA: hypothetical protein ENN94_05380 [Geoalkalibacter subterraneus]|uniref:Uncharacterized protein n=1 Tax=Geoalkalibacter subterraneus TaxID=483547 RepID=A0A831LLU3_9BACT|nr:hypothetical protein [Geoalkalibacter subterraneus]
MQVWIVRHENLPVEILLKTTQYLLAYRRVQDDLELVVIGPHENYYRDLKHYLKNR